jgi:Arc/MetJ-type ribon-helix-helix transcriptional regulator
MRVIIKMPPKIVTQNLRLSSQLVDWIDSLVQEGLYKSRGEAIREFIRDFLRGDGKI